MPRPNTYVHAARTLPFGRSVAVSPLRTLFMLPVAAQVAVVGLYNAALATEVGPPESLPPASNTCPFDSNVIVGQWLGHETGDSPDVRGPVGVQSPVPGL